MACQCDGSVEADRSPPQSHGGDPPQVRPHLGSVCGRRGRRGGQNGGGGPRGGRLNAEKWKGESLFSCFLSIVSVSVNPGEVRATVWQLRWPRVTAVQIVGRFDGQIAPKTCRDEIIAHQKLRRENARSKRYSPYSPQTPFGAWNWGLHPPTTRKTPHPDHMNPPNGREAPDTVCEGD